MQIERARTQVANLVNADATGVVFTSGATEANNMAMQIPLAQRFIVSAIEHPAVYNAREDVDIIPVDENGVVDLNALEEILQKDKKPALVSVMMVNNETGVIQPIKEIASLTRKYHSFTHTDAVQATARIPVDMKGLGVDLMSISGHKIGGPLGSGALVFANCVEPESLLKGGGQEKGRRSGTENVPGIVGLGVSCDKATEDMADYQKLSILRDRMEKELRALTPDITIHGEHTERVANTSMISIPGYSSETMLISFDLEGIAVSAGSACSSGKVKGSRILRAMGCPDDVTCSSLRISLGWNSTEEDVDLFLAAYKKITDRVKARLTQAS